MLMKDLGSEWKENLCCKEVHTGIVIPKFPSTVDSGRS